MKPLFLIFWTQPDKITFSFIEIQIVPLNLNHSLMIPPSFQNRQLTVLKSSLVLHLLLRFLLVVILFVILGRDLSDRDPAADTVAFTAVPVGTVQENIRLIFNATIISCLLYFTFLAMALIGVQTFGVAGLMQLYILPLNTATTGLAAFLVGSVIGVISGGFAADRTERHDLIAMLGMGLAAGAFLSIGTGYIGTSLLLPCLIVAGFVAGMTTPSRDMMVRKVTPPGASGRIFGFVYSGLDIGSAVMPLTLGIILDYAEADLMFYAIALMFAFTALTVRFVSTQIGRQSMTNATHDT